MRIDHFAYQQATRVSGFGLAIQLGFGLLLLVFGRIAGDTAFSYASTAMLAGCIPWAALIVAFHQHRLERLEALETEELASGHAKPESVFTAARAEGQVAARRLRFMHTVLIPIASLIYALLLAGVAWSVWQFFVLAADPKLVDQVAFGAGWAPGWQMAICLGLALIGFIFSRFLAGMATQAAWSALRGGASVMVANAISLLAIGVGVTFGVFGESGVLQEITRGLSLLYLAMAAEVGLNLLLNLYRPRRVGETPRPAFDSKILGLLAAPDSIVRSVNDAVNYQFGFDVTSTWGYQLLLRSVLSLGGLAIVVLVLLSTVVVVPPGFEALRLRGGAITGATEQSALLVKMPWPLESVATYDVARLRSVALGAEPTRPGAVNLWPIEGETSADRRPFIVQAAPLSAEVTQALQATATEETASLTDRFAVIEAEFVLRYRVKPGALEQYLTFVDDTPQRRGLSMRERAVRGIAMREASQLLAVTSFDQVLSPEGDSLVNSLRTRIQAAFDAAGAGIDVVSVEVPTLRPPPEAAAMFEERSIDLQNSAKLVDEAQRVVNTTMAALVGSVGTARRAVTAIDDLRRIEREQGADSEPADAQRAICESLLLESRAQAASVISAARATRWEKLMDARRVSQVVLGQADSYRVAPELYRQRAIMNVLGRALAQVRIKYILGVDPERIQFDIQMQQPDPGLNLADYLEKKSDKGGG